MRKTVFFHDDDAGDEREQVVADASLMKLKPKTTFGEF